MNELENSFSVNKNHFGTASKFDFSSKFIKPRNQKKRRFFKFDNAKTLVDKIDFQSNDTVYAIVDGSFIFGDFLEAFIIKHNIRCKEMLISSLSFSTENVDSLKNLIVGNYVEKINLIVSDYFFSHERNKTIKYIYDELDTEKCDFQLAVCRTHCKITQFETLGGKKIVIHGSANYRSSDNLEQIQIEHSDELYDFNKEMHDSIFSQYSTLKKTVRKVL